MASAHVRLLQCGPYLGIAFGRAKSHHDIVGMKNGFQPGTKQDRQIERGQRALANDYRMNEFD